MRLIYVNLCVSIEYNGEQTKVCKKLLFFCFDFGNSKIGQTIDGKTEIEEKDDGSSEMLPPAPPIKYSVFNRMLE